MPFIKHGDGKILNVVEDDELTDEQKKSVKKVSEDQSNSKLSDSSIQKQSGSK